MGSDVNGPDPRALASCLVFLMESDGLSFQSLEVKAWESLVLDVAASVFDRATTTERLRRLLE